MAESLTTIDPKSLCKALIRSGESAADCPSQDLSFLDAISDEEARRFAEALINSWNAVVETEPSRDG